MPEMKTLQGYEIVDAKAREDIEGLRNEGHALKSELPTKVSQLENDSKFITREEVPETDLSEYAKKSELPTVPKKVSELTNDTGYITLAEVPKTDLSDYAKKSDIPDVSDFITNIPDEYITEAELNAKGYLTEHQDISGKADKVHYHSEYLTEHQSLANYATKKYVDDAIAGIDKGDSFFLDFSGATEEEQPATDELIAFINHLNSHNNTACLYLKDRYHHIFLPASFNYSGAGLYLAITAASIVNVTDPIDYIFVREESGNYYYSISSTVDNPYTTKAYVDDAIANIDIPEPDLTGYATEHYVDSTKLAILDIYNCNKLSESSWQLTDNVENIIQRLFAGERFPITVAPYSHIQYIPSSISITSDEIKIKLDTSHMWTGVDTYQLTGLYTDIYVFTNTNGIIELQITQSKINVADAYEYSQQLAALEARVAALEGGNN